MNQLDYITVRGFKSIASLEKLNLGKLTILIGANGAGKTNLIDIFSFLRAFMSGRLATYVRKAGGANRVLHLSSQDSKALEIEVSFNKECNGYRIRMEPIAGDRLTVVDERTWHWDKNNCPRREWTQIPRHMSGNEAGFSESRTRFPACVKQHLKSWHIYHFHDTGDRSPMKITANVHDNRLLRDDGANLASFLYLLRQKHANSYSFIVDTIRLVAPFLRDFALAPEELNPDRIRLQWEHAGSDAYFDADSLSDGTLRFVALTTLFLQPPKYRPSVILVDEPELGLHPYAINLLASLIKQAAASTQVIVSTQSSSLLDHFEPEDVIVTDRKDGASEFTRLESAELKDWLDDYSLGQLWEKNEFGGRPAYK